VHFHAEHALRTDNMGEEQVAAFDHAINPPDPPSNGNNGPAPWPAQPNVHQ
jgi:hypothetical protein